MTSPRDRRVTSDFAFSCSSHSSIFPAIAAKPQNVYCSRQSLTRPSSTQNVQAMEAAPPSYETATLTNPWTIIAPYVYPSDYLSACLVCRSWHAVFAARLWANPTAGPALDLEQQQEILDRFIECLPHGRPAVLALTRTIDASQMRTQQDISSRPDAAWLRTVLSRLPSLQALLLSSEPSLGQLTSSRVLPDVSCNLRLLDVSGCPSVVCVELQRLLRRMPGLVYLDLSRSSAWRNIEGVFQALPDLVHLRILKICHAGLVDWQVERLALSVRRTLRSLDLRGNDKITMSGVAAIRRVCAPPIGSLNRGHGIPRAETDTTFEAQLKSVLENGYAGRLSIEDAPDRGITHLYLSGTAMNDQGFMMVLRFWPLFVLDFSCGHQQRRHPGTSCLEEDHQPADEIFGDLASEDMEMPPLTFPLISLRASFENIFEFSSCGSPWPQPWRSPHKIGPRDGLDNELGHRSPHGEPPIGRRSEDGHVQQLSEHSMNTEPGEYQHFAETKFLFHPVMFPNLRQLVIFDVPSRSYNACFASDFLHLLDICGQLSRRAHVEAQADWTRAPTRGGETPSQALASAARARFALETIVLQIRLPCPSFRAPNPSYMSITGEHGTEPLWTSGKTDFSFFDPGFAQGATVEGDRLVTEEHNSRLSFDNIGRIGRFRAEAKAAYERKLAEGERWPVVKGYWPGVIKIVRPSYVHEGA